MANRLIDEQSPYLLQHAHNPVNWYPWGDEAFEVAARENKPVIVSIGYAACHWCHVMERESFEDETTAAFMNEHFINIKVDREEHPDVDHLYMDAVQAITQQGGWPLNVFVSPERVPFYGGTYFPPRPLYGRASWMQVLQQISNVWTNEHGEVETQTNQMLGYLKQISEVAFSKAATWTAADCRLVADTMLTSADKELGGFGSAPKFPGTMSITYLLEHYNYTGYEPALKQALRSLDAMADGGIYDQLGGGFARYSTDARWLAPHFEKMLYDNALLVMAYADAYTITRNERYKLIVSETIDFVNRELVNEQGGFYCALDADSEGVEGKFYTFTWDEWQAVTGGDEVAEQYFGIVPEGNWEHTNILHIAASVSAVATAHNMSEEEVLQRIDIVKQKLWAQRETRIRPATDDKSLLSWNALMNMALSKAGQVFGNEKYTAQATQHMHWMTQAYLAENRWQHTWKNGVAKIPAKLDDYACLIAAMLQLSSITADTQWIVKAAGLIEIVQAEFLHDNKSFFYYSSVLQTDIPVRKTDLYDAALPSANSIMASNLILAGMLMERSDWVEQGQYLLRQMQGAATRYGTSFANWAVYGQRMAAGYRTAVVAGNDALSLQSAIMDNYHPHVYYLAQVQATDGGVPLLHDKFNIAENSVYVCDATSCMAPEKDINAIESLLKNKL